MSEALSRDQVDADAYYATASRESLLEEIGRLKRRVKMYEAMRRGECAYITAIQAHVMELEDALNGKEPT